MIRRTQEVITFAKGQLWQICLTKGTEMWSVTWTMWVIYNMYQKSVFLSKPQLWELNFVFNITFQNDFWNNICKSLEDKGWGVWDSVIIMETKNTHLLAEQFHCKLFHTSHYEPWFGLFAVVTVLTHVFCSRSLLQAKLFLQTAMVKV